MGLIMVIGIVAKNGILLLDANEKFRSIGFTAGGSDRPGRTPAAAADRDDGDGGARRACCRWRSRIGEGSQMLQPLAIAVIGGILISMVLSLIVTPGDSVLS